MLVFSFPNSTSFHLCSIHSWRLQNLFPAWLLSSWQPKKRWRATVKSLPKNCWKWFLYLGLKVFRSHRRSASSSGLHRRTIGDLWSFSCLFPVVTKHCFVPKLFYYLGSKAVAVFFFSLNNNQRDNSVFMALQSLNNHKHKTCFLS